MFNFRDVLEGMLNLVFPRSPGCPICGAGNEPELCLVCREAMYTLSERPYCHRCGRFLHSVTAVSHCPECRTADWPFDACRAFGPYEGVLRDAVHRLKYDRQKELALPLGKLMARTVRRRMAYYSADFLVPIPLTEVAFWRRGFNQADLLAATIGRELGIPVRPVLAKVRETPAQAGLSREARLVNLAGCFTLAGEPAEVYNRTVVLVDDVFTTGSTLSEAARMLRGAGASRVLGLVFVAGRK